MSLILNIDTTTETALVNIALTGHIIDEEINTQQKDHAAFLHTAVDTLLKKAKIELNQLDAIAVSIGPGFYTGIRVGMSSAKGFCFALNKPLITLNTLEILTKDVTDNCPVQLITPSTLFCPMIDARRLEVFTALYKSNLDVVMPPSAMILDDSSFVNLLLNTNMVFFGNGASKWQRLCVHENASFQPITNKGLAMSSLSFQKLQQKNFSPVAYAEPLYVKEFYTAPNTI